MSTEELISRYEDIIRSLRDTGVDQHPLEAIRNEAKKQIARCEKAIAELKELLPA